MADTLHRAPDRAQGRSRRARSPHATLSTNHRTAVLHTTVLCIALCTVLCAWASHPCQAARQPSGRAARGTPDGVVNINTATAEQLRLLPSIGPAKAERIIAYRTRRKFGTTQELMRVKGIGRRTYRRLQRHLVVDGPTTLRRRPRPADE